MPNIGRCFAHRHCGLAISSQPGLTMNVIAQGGNSAFATMLPPFAVETCPAQASGMPAATQALTSSNVAAKRFSISSTCSVVMIIGGHSAMLSPTFRMIRP
jgi:hypothetical protein